MPPPSACDSVKKRSSGYLLEPLNFIVTPRLLAYSILSFSCQFFSRYLTKRCIKFKTNDRCILYMNIDPSNGYKISNLITFAIYM